RCLPAADRLHVHPHQPRGRRAVLDPGSPRAPGRGEMSAVALSTETPLRRFWSQFAESRLALFGLTLLAAVIAIALLAPWISPQNPYDLGKLDLLDARLPPG